MDLAFFSVSLSFKLNSYLWKTPLQWDPVRHRFIYVPGGWRVFFWWYFVIFGVYVSITLGSIGWVFWGQIYHPNPRVKFVFLVQYALAFVAGWLAAAITLFVAFYGVHFVRIMNRAIQLLEDLSDVKKGKKRKKQRKLFGIAIPELRGKNGKLDRAGLLLFLILFPLPFLSCISAPVSILVAKDDVYQFVLEDMIPLQVRTHPVVNSVLILLRIGLMWIAITESMRIFPFLVFLFGIPGQVVTKTVEYFNNIHLDCESKEWVWDKALRDFTTLRLISLEVEPELAEDAFILMGVGLLFSCSLNFASIRFLDSDMPRGYYLMFPFLTFAVFVLIFTLVPVAIGIHEDTKKALRQWALGTGTRNAILRKRVQAVRPLKFYAGLNRFYFYSFDKYVLSTYMMIILDYTVNLLLSLPAGNFISKKL